MKTVKTIFEARETLTMWRLERAKIAFVPTMGNLHEGHLALVKKARAVADKVVVSIFVNPTQFGKGEDFQTYPRTEATDAQLLVETGADLLFLPPVSEIYPDNCQTTITVAGLSDQYCGRSRPRHFDGVATVVCKLFNIMQPDCALFGQKDFQQLTIIRRLVLDLDFPVEIIAVETVREASGLAMSSRNGYLSANEKMVAANLFRSLCQARDAVLAGHEFSEIERQAGDFLVTSGFLVDYFTICRASDLKKAECADNDLVILTAAKLGNTRLIDNIRFNR